MSKFTKRASEVLIACAAAGFISQSTIAPAFAENRMSDIPRGNFAKQIPTPQCDGFEDYMRDAAKHVQKVSTCGLNPFGRVDSKNKHVAGYFAAVGGEALA